MIGHGAILSTPKVTLAPRGIKWQKRLACVGSEQYRVRLVKPVMHGKLCMLQRFKSQRGMCAESKGVRHLDRERAQARCVVATTVLPHSCRVGRVLLHPGRHQGWERVQRQLRMFRPGLYCPRG